MFEVHPVPYRLVTHPAFRIAGRQTFISGPDNDQFGQFWQECRAQGWLSKLNELKKSTRCPAGPQTGAAFLGVSRVEQDPTNRAFNYMIAVEVPGEALAPDLELYDVPACDWAVFECHGQPPMSIVQAEMYAFIEWLPNSGYHHALAPEMEVYPADRGENYQEFWLPVIK